MIYTVSAYWLNAAAPPEVRRSGHLADALELSLALMHSHKHTIISVQTPDNLELVRLWGQPMPNGQDWP